MFLGLDSGGSGIPGREGGGGLVEDFEDFFGEVLAGDNDGVDVFGEPIVVEGPFPLAAFLVAPAIFDEPFGGFSFEKVNSDEGHGVV